MWLIAALAIAFAGAAFVAGRGFSFGFANGPYVEVAGGLGEVSEEQLEDSQADLAQDADEATARVEESAPAVPSAFDERFAGSWVGASAEAVGFRYEIFQVGASATITESNAFGLITAVGEGTIVDGETFSFTYTAANGAFGSGELRISADDQRLSGFLQQQFGSTELELVRR